MNYKSFITEQVEAIRRDVGDRIAITALSGGVDSSVVTVLAHRALGNQLKAIFVDNAIMREGEPQRVVKAFKAMGIDVELIDARKQFLRALKGLTDPEAKRQAITDTFYRDVFGKAVKRTRATFLLHGTILTNVEIDHLDHYGSFEGIVAGFDTFPETLLKLFTGENTGKLVLKVADE